MFVPFQPLSNSVYQTKYQLRDKFGNEVDKGREGTFLRVAKALAHNEMKQDYWEEQFFLAMLRGAIPAGRILSNVGAEEHKPNTSAINCTVSKIVEDSIEGIGQAVKEAGITLSSGSGIGYCFSTLRPKGSFVSGVGAKTSGPLPFMDIFDKMCFTIASAGGRRGAQMATFDISHPDVVDFIKAKREDGRFRQFNVSVLVPEQFMDFDKKDWNFKFPVRTSDPFYQHFLRKENLTHFSWDFYHINDSSYVKNDEGLTLFKNYTKINKADLWDLIMRSAYDFAEPGVMFIDRFNQENNLYFAEYLNVTNPCSEQMLPPHGSCLLGSVDLTKFVIDPFTDAAHFDWAGFRNVVKVFTRLLDNVVEFNGLPLEEQQAEIFDKRRHGMGIMGLGSSMVMLGLRYGSDESLDFAASVMKLLAMVGYQTGLELAKEKGSAPIMEDSFEVTPLIAKYNPAVSGLIGKKLLGRELFVKSSYMQKLFSCGLEREEFSQYGCRFTHHSSIAPTGTISLAMCNNISGGVEPSFSHRYFRNLTVEGKKTRQQETVYSYEALLYKELNKIPDEELLSKLPDYFVTADTLTWKEHIDVLAVVQYWCDSGTSKTVNVPTEISFEEFKDLYSYAYESGCKAVATYRYNPETLGAVLSREADLEKTRYQFKLEDGTVIECKGNDNLEYDGEVTTAENLFNALKEGTYSKF